jgi:YfiH family protein
MMPFQNESGFGYKSAEALVFFGNTKTTLETLQKEFPDLNFRKLKQVHGDRFAQASATITEADGHYSSLKNEALLIATADCMPIMIYCSHTNRTAAIHAGWRGVENKITEKILKYLISNGSSSESIKIFIGPSILQKSFEVDEDVYRRLIDSSNNLQPQLCSYAANNKYYVDLNKILLSQVQYVLGNSNSVTLSLIDTKTDLNFHSYRRGKLKPDRNLSFVCLLT